MKNIIDDYKNIKNEIYDLVIIGGGLSGLYLLNKLLKENNQLRICLLECSNRLGGRINTIRFKDKSIKSKPINIQYESGGARFSNKHENLIKLLKHLNLEKDKIAIPSKIKFMGFPKERYEPFLTGKNTYELLDYSCVFPGDDGYFTIGEDGFVTDEFIEFSEELSKKQKEGEAPGLYPGGYDKFLKDKGYVKDEDGRVVKKEEEKEIVEKVEEVPTDTPEIEVKDSKKEESLNVGADLKKTQKLFEELLGMDKARRRDVGDMLGRASAAFLGAPSVREGLADFMRTESATGPGRGEKIGQTAAALAINDYIAGKKSKADLEKLLAAEKFRTDYKLSALKEGLSFDDKLLAAADKEGKSKKSISVIQSVVDDTFGEGAFKGPLPKDVNQLEIGAVYVGDSEDKSYKIVYQVNQEKVPIPIKNIF